MHVTLPTIWERVTRRRDVLIEARGQQRAANAVTQTERVDRSDIHLLLIAVRATRYLLTGLCTVALGFNLS